MFGNRNQNKQIQLSNTKTPKQQTYLALVTSTQYLHNQLNVTINQLESKESDWMTDYLWCEYLKLTRELFTIVLGITESEPNGLNDASEIVAKAKLNIENMLQFVNDFQKMYSHYESLVNMIGGKANDFRISEFEKFIVNIKASNTAQGAKTPPVQPLPTFPSIPTLNGVNGAKKPYQDVSNGKYYNRWGNECGQNEYRKDLMNWINQ